MKIDLNEHKSESDSSSQKFDIITNLPPELTNLILSFLFTKELFAASAVSHDWRKRIDRDNLWKTRLKSLGTNPKSFKEQYVTIETIFQNCVTKIYDAIFQDKSPSSLVATSSDNLAIELHTSGNFGNYDEQNSCKGTPPDELPTGGLGIGPWPVDGSLFGGDIFTDNDHTLDNAAEDNNTTDNYLGGGLGSPHSRDIIFSNLLNQITYHHFKAVKKGISTYKIFNSILKKIRAEKPQSSWKNAKTTVLYYLLYISDILDPPAVMKGLYLPRASYPRISCRDYHDILSLIKNIILDETIDLNMNFGYISTKNALDFMTSKSSYISRPSPSIISLLIQRGVNFDFQIFYASYNNIPITDILIFRELKFHILTHSTNQKNSELSHKTCIEEYENFIGKENLISSAHKPLSNEFINMASIILNAGGEFSSFNDLKASPLVSNRFCSFFDTNDVQTEKLLLAACIQLEKLKAELKQNTNFCHS